MDFLTLSNNDFEIKDLVELAFMTFADESSDSLLSYLIIDKIIVIKYTSVILIICLIQKSLPYK